MCMSGAKGQTALAANMAIGLMLVFILSVLAAFLGFIVYLSKRARMVTGEEDAMAANNASQDIE